MAKLKRPQFAVFINVSDTETPDFRLCGVYTDELSLSYNPVTEESQDVTEVASTTDVTNYALSFDIATKVVAATGQKGFKVSDYVNKMRKGLATASSAQTEVLLVDLYTAGTEDPTAFFAQKFSAAIAFSSYGGAASETLGMEYTVYCNGEPVNGEAAITTEDVSTDKLASFTASV